MPASLDEILSRYDADAPLERAATIPAAWYTDPRLLDLERRSVFRNWQCVGRVDQVTAPGQFFTADVAGQPLLVVRGGDGLLRAFFNVCRHHAAAVCPQAEGQASVLRCPYHGWTYSLAGELRGTPDFDSVLAFERADHGLRPVTLDTWEGFVFVRVDEGPSLRAFLGPLAQGLRVLELDKLRFFERRTYLLEANWKVFVDNYLDGGYHVPYVHGGLDSVLDYAHYTIENGPRFCLQKSPLRSSVSEPAVGAVRQGDWAYYYWLYPNFMLNWYQGALDTNLVLPLGVERTLVVFDFYFEDVSEAARERNAQSVALSERIQHEDVGVCLSVQRGLASGAYEAGRLSVRREAGEHLFHRLLAADLRAAAAQNDGPPSAATSSTASGSRVTKPSP
jgi:choline monooxygenase